MEPVWEDMKCTHDECGAWYASETARRGDLAEPLCLIEERGDDASAWGAELGSQSCQNDVDRDDRGV